MRRPGLMLSFLLVLSVPACGDDDTGPDYADPAQVAVRLRTTLDDLAALGEKRCGTPAGHAAGDYIRERFEAAGLQDVTFEEFSFLHYEVQSSQLDVTVDGVALPMDHEVFAYSGVGTVDATVSWLGTGDAEAYEGRDVTGHVVLVERSETLHRQAQYELAWEHGAVAMLYVSAAPDNVIQIGTVSDPEDGLGPMPAVTVGSEDGADIVEAAEASALVRASITVEATVSPATGRNVVGWLRGASPGDGFLLVGGHYDTWYVGSMDNGGAVAATVEIAEALAHRHRAGQTPRRLDLAFVAYDGEELGLFGGYHFLREHVIRNAEPLLAFVNFEMPATGADGLRAMAYTHGGAVDGPLLRSDLPELYPFVSGMEIVPSLFGGFIPTDIQGLYWSGLQGITTACTTPWYHTPEDTPDRIDYDFFADAVLAFQGLLDTLDAQDPSVYGAHDDEVWQLEVTPVYVDGTDVPVDVVVRDGAGDPAADAPVWYWLDVDDFTRVFRGETVTNDLGEAGFVIPADAAGAGSGHRWIHVRAGDRWPLGESMVPLE